MKKSSRILSLKNREFYKKNRGFSKVKETRILLEANFWNFDDP